MKSVTRLVFSLALLFPAQSVWSQSVVNDENKDAGFTLALTEELRFGAVEDGEEYLWPTLNTKIFPGPNGQMFVFDYGGRRALAFDKDGNFIKVVARPGNGPGELQFVTCVSQAADGSIFVMDTVPNSLPSLNCYNPDMSFREKISTLGLEYFPAVVSISPDGKNLGGLFAKADQASLSMQLKTGVMSLADKKMIQDVGTIQVPLPNPARLQEQDMWVNYIAGQLKVLYQYGLITFGTNGVTYAGISNKYEITRRQPGQQEPDLTFSLKYKPKPFGEKRAELVDHFYENIDNQSRQIITKGVMSKALEEAKLPLTKAPMVGIIPIEDKGILVIREVDMKTRHNRGDVFSREGRFLCSMEIEDYGLFAYSTNNPSPRMVFRDGYAYTILTNEDGDNEAVRFAYSLKKS